MRKLQTTNKEEAVERVIGEYSLMEEYPFGYLLPRNV